MSHKQEIEVKVEVGLGKFNEILAKLGGDGNAVTVHHTDIYFSPADRDFLAEEFPFEWLSIRERGSDIRLSYKHFHPEGAERHTYCDEFEVGIDNAEAGRGMLLALGYEEVASVIKTRRSFEWLDKYEVALDVVEGLGYFIEIEVIHQTGTPSDERRQFAAVLESLGLDEAPVNLRGYPFMIHAMHKS
ncbi:MAG: class IV adenylate cyclase [Bifidobacteriaceae bacterium]|nr:class IV adenylate cyclase [Bifidobacteriaceae bacterium]